MGAEQRGKRVKTTKKNTTKVFTLGVTFGVMFLHADSDAKKVLIHETITENKKTHSLIKLSQQFPISAEQPA